MTGAEGDTYVGKAENGDSHILRLDIKSKNRHIKLVRP